MICIFKFFVRLEKFNLGTAGGKAKIIGTLTGIGGAMLLTFYKGSQIDTPSFHLTFLHPHNGHVAYSHSSSGGNMPLGALCALSGCLSYALWLIVQVRSLTTFTTVVLVFHLVVYSWITFSLAYRTLKWVSLANST